MNTSRNDKRADSIYPEDEVYPSQWPHSLSAKLGLIRFGRVKYYRITTLNLPGAPPSVHGQPPFVATPCSYQSDHKDPNGSLGPYEWTRLPQYIKDVKYAVPHRAFVTPKSPTLAITTSRLPKVTTVQSDSDEELFRIQPDFLIRVQKQSDEIRAAYHSYVVKFQYMQFKLASPFDFEWALGNDWTRLLTKAQRPLNTNGLRDWTHDVRRRMLDAQAFVEFSLRQLIHHILYLGAYEQPVWPTEARFIGVIIAEEDQDARLYGAELARLGAPVWAAQMQDPNPPLRIMPPGSSTHHPIYRALWKDARRRYPTDQAQAQQHLRQQFELWAGELTRRGYATPEEIWWIRTKDSGTDLPRGNQYNDPKGISAPSRAGLKELFAVHILTHVAVIPGRTETSMWTLQEKLHQRIAFLSQTFGTIILPLKIKDPLILGVVPALFQDNRNRLQTWSQELFPQHQLPPASTEPSLPPKAETVDIAGWLHKLNESIEIPAALTLGVIDRLDVPSRPLISARIRSPEPEGRRTRRRLEHHHDSQDRGDLPESWIDTYDEPRNDVASAVTAGPTEYKAQTLPLLDGHIYIIMEAFPALPVDKSRQIIFYDRFGTRGATGCGILDDEDKLSFTLTLQFQGNDERVVRSIIENQSRASQWFSGSEPRKVYVASDQRSVVPCTRWDPQVITTHNQLRQDRDDGRRQRYMGIGGPPFTPASILTLLGPRIDGRQDLYERLSERFSLTLPLVTSNLPPSFNVAYKVEYPKGSSYIVMTRYRIAPCLFMCLLEHQVQVFKEKIPLTLNVPHPLDIMLQNLRKLMAYCFLMSCMFLL
jgi:hypothetical protein